MHWHTLITKKNKRKLWDSQTEWIHNSFRNPIFVYMNKEGIQDGRNNQRAKVLWPCIFLPLFHQYVNNRIGELTLNHLQASKPHATFF